MEAGFWISTNRFVREMHHVKKNENQAQNICQKLGYILFSYPDLWKPMIHVWNFKVMKVFLNKE